MIQIDMEMPKNCFDCPFYRYSCSVSIVRADNVHPARRLSECPLIDVPDINVGKMERKINKPD